MEKLPTDTIEFYIPRRGLNVKDYILAEEKQGIHHVGRYEWATDVIKTQQSQRILDIACGAGYGAMKYATACPQAKVVGVDYDERAVSWAKENYSRHNLSFHVGNIVTWKFDGDLDMGKFDVISSFDTLEHLLHREIALINIVENLEPNGIFLFSTPCGHKQTKLNPGWEHHKIEYSYIDLYNLLRRFFKIVKIPDDGSLPNLNFWNDIINFDKVRYLNRYNPIVCMLPIKFGS